MLKQTIVFKNKASLSLRNNQMIIALNDGEREVSRPIEDIGVILVENQQVNFTIPLLNSLAEHNVAVVLCDVRSMPKSILLPFEGNTTQQESLRLQVETSAPTNKQAWKQIIECKIRNQSNLLSKLGKDGDMLKVFYCNVKSGDSDNREGAAARIYWKLLFGNSFSRDRDGLPPNNLLNYGYAILRAAVTRALVKSGLHPSFGIFHRNKYNAFPLADDIMEPYRPFVDEVVASLFDSEQVSLTTDVKSELQRILFCDVGMGSQTRPLEVALSMTTASLLKLYKGQSSKLNLPKLL